MTEPINPIEGREGENRVSDHERRIAHLETLEPMMVPGDLPFAVPAITLGLANAEGAADFAIRNDATLIAQALGFGVGIAPTADRIHTYRNDASTVPTLLIEQDGAGDAAQQFLETGGQVWSVGLDNSLSNAFVVAAGAALQTNPRLVIEPGGDVGIGETDPLLLLHLSDGSASGLTAAVGEGIIITEASTGRLYFEDTGEGAGDKVMVLYHQDGFLTIGSTTDTGAAWDQQYILRISRDGNVGIDDIAPGHRLDVNGDINMVAGSGLMINDTAANRHVLIGDGARGVFRALVAADLPGLAPVHVVNSGGPHAEAGLTIGHTLRVTGAAAFSFAALQHGDLGGVGAADHQALVTLGANLAANLLTLAAQDITLDNQNANLVFAGPAAGGPAAPAFRAIVAADLPVLGSHWTKLGADMHPTVLADEIGLGIALPLTHLHLYEDTASTTPAVRIEQDGAGDAALNFLLTGGLTWSMGIDNSDGNKFKIATGASVHLNTRITILATGLVGINDTAPAHVLDVTGDINIVAGAGLMINDTAANRHVLIGDGARGVFRALVAADLPGLIYGGISATDSAVVTAIAVAGVAVQITVFDVNNPSNGATPDHTNDHITIVTSGDYYIAVSATVNSIVGAGSRFEMRVQKNNGAANVDPLHVDRNVGGGAVESGSVSMSGIAALTAADTIEVWIENETNTQNYVVESITLTVIEIGG